MMEYRIVPLDHSAGTIAIISYFSAITQVSHLFLQDFDDQGNAPSQTDSHDAKTI